jgi:hypothetical protein
MFIKPTPIQKTQIEVGTVNQIVVSDGTIYNPVTMSGDATIDSAGVISVVGGQADALHIHGKVNEVAGITIGQVVYITGATGGAPQVSLADNTEFSKADTIALATESKTNNQSIVVATSGLLEGVDTSAFVEGDILYLGVAGAVTATHPSGINAVQRIGHAVKINASTGSILISIDELTIINDHDGIMRHQIVNQNAGAEASTSYTLVNDLNHRSSISMVGSNFNALPIAESLVIYNEGYNDTFNVVDGNFGFQWWTDITDSHNLSSNVKMSLSPIGALEVADSVLITGGLSTEFLKADGSVDTSIYITDLSSFTTTNLTEGTNLYYTDVRVSANSAVALNTAKISFDSTSSTRLANTSGINTGDQDVSGFVSKVGTPVDNQLGIWTGDGTLEGDANLILDGAEFIVTGSQYIKHTSTIADDYALEIQCDAVGFGDVKAVDINYITGAIGAGVDEGIILINIDETLSVGGEVFALEVLTTTLGSDKVIAVKTGVGIDPISQDAGTFGDAPTILNKAVDVTTELADGGAGNITIFVADNDTITVGNINKFSEMEVILGTGASQNVNPDWEYSTGVGTWASFTPTDGTNGFGNTGAVLWDETDLVGWVAGTGSEFLIRITRTRNNLTTDPIVDEIQIAEVVLFSWDLNGDIIANSIDVGGTSSQYLKADGSLGSDALIASGVDNDQTGTTYTLVLTDADNKSITMTNASANTLTIPLNASVAFPVGTKIPVSQLGAGLTTIEGDTGVTVNGVSAGTKDLGGIYTSALLWKRATDTWVVI